jgi:hypothetical protein
LCTVLLLPTSHVKSVGRNSFRRLRKIPYFRESQSLCLLRDLYL